MAETKKLYRVTLTGMTSSAGSSPIYGYSYVVADDPTSAYETVRKSLDEKDIGFSKDREMDKIELIAECADYPDCQIILYIQGEI